MLILTASDIKQSFSMKDAIQADKEALGLYTEGKAIVPLRTNLPVDAYNGQSLYMPAVVSGKQVASGLKVVSVYPENPKKNLPSVPASVMTLDAETCLPSALLEGTYLTQLRTGAVQGAATDLLARKDAKIGALIGTGGQAESQLEAMLTARDLEEVRVYALDFDVTKAFAEKMTDKFNKPIHACQTAQEAVEGADVITTVTTSKQATFDDAWIKPGAHINGIGSYTPEMCEIPVATIKRADKIFFDTLDGVWGEAGDFIQPLNKGEIKEDDVTGELGALVNGQVTGRQSDDEITIFKSVGSAVLDVYVADQIVRAAKKKGLGQSVNLD